MDTIRQVLFNNCIIKNSNRGVDDDGLSQRLRSRENIGRSVDGGFGMERGLAVGARGAVQIVAVGGWGDDRGAFPFHEVWGRRRGLLEFNRRVG